MYSVLFLDVRLVQTDFISCDMEYPSFTSLEIFQVISKPEGLHTKIWETVIIGI